MKKTLLAGVLLLLLCLSGCKLLFPLDPTTPTPAGGTEDQLEMLEREDSIVHTDGTTLVHYTVNLPQFSPDEGYLGKINDYYVTEYANFISTAEGELRQIAEGNLESHDQDGTTYMACEARQSYEIRRQDQRYISISREIGMSFGASLVEQYFKGDTFDLQQEKQMRLADVFCVPSEEYLPILRDLVIEQLEQRLQTAEGGQYYPSATERVEDFILEDNFWLTDTALVLFFPEGGLGPVGEGVPSFEIPYTTLSELLAEGIA